MEPEGSSPHSFVGFFTTRNCSVHGHGIFKIDKCHLIMYSLVFRIQVKDADVTRKSPAPACYYRYHSVQLWHAFRRD
jgi:hypothetical protein